MPEHHRAQKDSGCVYEHIIVAEKKLGRKLKIDKDVLYNLLLNNSFSKAGKMFGITDNAIRKYCKKFNIPYKSSDYKKK